MSRGKTILKCVVIGLLVATIFLQAVARLLSGNIFYVNYKNQPLNSFGALIVVAIVLMAGIVLLWRRLRAWQSKRVWIRAFPARKFALGMRQKIHRRPSFAPKAP